MPVTPNVNVLHLDEAAQDAIPVSDAVGDWIPIRRLLDVRAFGINAWIARRAGDVAVEDHDEAGDDGDPGQEELYLVLRGAARFTVGDHEIDARAGTIVHIAEPALRRRAVALEDGTMTLSLGNAAGAFSPSEWETRWLRELGREP